jgi:hypothetical protein
VAVEGVRKIQNGRRNKAELSKLQRFSGVLFFGDFVSSESESYLVPSSYRSMLD